MTSDAAVVKLVYTLVSGTSAAMRGGSSPLCGTINDELRKLWRECAAFSLVARSANQRFFRGEMGNWSLLATTNFPFPPKKTSGLGSAKA